MTPRPTPDNGDANNGNGEWTRTPQKEQAQEAETGVYDEEKKTQPKRRRGCPLGHQVSFFLLFISYFIYSLLTKVFRS